MKNFFPLNYLRVSCQPNTASPQILQYLCFCSILLKEDVLLLYQNTTIKTQKLFMLHYYHLTIGSHSSFAKCPCLCKKMVPLRITCYLQSSCFFSLLQIGRGPHTRLDFHNLHTLEDYSQLSCRTSLSLACLMSPHHQIPIIHFWQKYPTSDVVFFSVQPIRRHKISVCPIANGIHFSGLGLCLPGFSITLFSPS